MFARVTITQSPPERYDEMVRFVEGRLLPAIRQIPGVVHSYQFGDRQTGKGMTITIYESEAAMRAADQAASQLRGQGSQQIGGLGIQSVETYEVVGQL